MIGVEKKYYIVQDRATLELMFHHIEECEVIALDTETTDLNPRKGTIVGWSISGKVGMGFYLPVYVWDSVDEKLKEQFIDGISVLTISRNLLKMLRGKKLVAHNASFDLRYIKNNYGLDLVESLWVDTAMLVHTVQEDGVGMGVFRLKDIAIEIQSKIGLDVERAANQEQIDLKESIRKNGGSTTKSNFEIFKADLEILGKYGASDADLTLRVCYYFLEILKQEEMEHFFFEEEVMPIYKEVTIPMEELGVQLDLELLRQTDEEITADLEENKKIVMKSLLAEPAVQQWVIDTALATYPISNKGNWAQAFVDKHKLPLPISPKTGKYTLSSAVLKLLPESPQKEFLLTGNEDVLDYIEATKLSMELWAKLNDGDYINIQSTKHLGEIVFNYLGEKPLSQTEKGQNQFDMGMIDELSKKYTWAENLRVYNKLLKIKSTYIDRFLEGQEDGKYYFYYKQNGTVSGRYGSDAQQLPKPREEGQDVEIVVRYTNKVRAFLVAGEGRKIIDSDFESLEPHCFASVSGDEGLREIFRKNWDFYSTIAIKTEKLDENKRLYPNGVSADKSAPNYLKLLDPGKRNRAKSYALGIAYGMEAFALSKNLGVSKKEAEDLVNGYINGFPGLKKWREVSRKQAKEHGFIKNYVGRIRHLPKVREIYAQMGDSLMDWQYRRSLSTVHGIKVEDVLKLYRDYRNGLNNCLNFQLQSLAASIVNRAALRINRKLRELNIDGRVQAQIHDQLIINVPEDQAEFLAPIVQHLMETAVELPGVVLKAPPQIGNNWLETH